MAVSLKHNFVSAKVDSVDTTLVQPSNWNAEHTLTLATSSILGRSSAGTGVAQEIPVGTGVFTALGTSIGSAGAFVTNTSPTLFGLTTISSGEARLDLTATNANGRNFNLYSGGGGNVGAGAFAITENGATTRFVIVGGGAGESMRIDASGNVGIGTTSFSHRLQVQVPAGAQNIFLAGQTGVSNGYQITSNGTALTYQWFNTSSEAMRLDASGNLGIGATPSAWFADRRVMQLGSGASVNGSAATSSFVEVGSNFYQNASSADVYVASSTASKYRQISGAHQWFTAPSGTAGNVITFTQAMTLDASGNLGIGVTPSAWTTGGTKAVQLPGGSVVGFTNGSNNNQVLMLGNCFFNTPGNPVYINSDFATYYRQYTGEHVWFTAPSGTAGNLITFTQAMTLSASGNLGIGATPSPWGSNFKALDIGGNVAIAGYSNSMFQLANAYAENAAYRYKASTFASAYLQTAGQHQWFNAPSGTAGNAITFTQAMTLDASGNLGIGTTSPSNLLTLGGNSGGIDFANWNNDRIVFNHAFNASFFQRIVFDAATRDFRIQSNSSDSTAKISFWTGASGTVTERMRLDASGNLIIGTAALATTATAGFPWIPSCAGVPTGAPTAPYTNAAAMVVDTTNNRLYVRVGTTWRFVTLT